EAGRLFRGAQPCVLVQRTRSAANLGDVLRRRALLALHDVEFDRVTLGERLEAAALDGAVVHEAVLLPVVGRDETEPLRVVEPLHLSGRAHSRTPNVVIDAGSGNTPTLTIRSARVR